MNIQELKKGIKAAYKQCLKPIAHENSWESLLWAQPLTNTECLCVCLKDTYYKHRSPFNKAFNNIPKSTLVLKAWSVSQGLFGVANRHSYTLAPSGRYSSDQGKWFPRGWTESAHKTTKDIGLKELICQCKGPEDQHLLHRGLKLHKMSALPATLSKSGAVLGHWSPTIMGRWCSQVNARCPTPGLLRQLYLQNGNSHDL